MRFRKIFKITCLVLVLLGLLQVTVYAAGSLKHKKEEQQLSQILERSQVQATQEKSEASDTEALNTENQNTEAKNIEILSVPTVNIETKASLKTESELAMLDKFTTLYEENLDIIGWLSIEGTKIDYPVMQNEFDYFYDNIKSLALYDTGAEASFGDTFITLSTCAYHVEDGRLAVVAKRIK